VDRHQDSERYGVVSMDSTGRPTEIVEKLCVPPSNWAVIGLYFYDHRVGEFTRRLRPSNRGGLEITDLNRICLEEEPLHVERLGRCRRLYFQLITSLLV
jgi:glucose-1-phosphate thymidylyltransferase